MKLKVAVLQYDVPLDSGKSFEKLNEMVGQATFAGAKLIVAPETAIGNFKEVKETGIDYFDRLSDIAKRNEVYLATSYYKKEKGKIFNQGQIVSPFGKSVLNYKKIYPARPEIEDLGVVAGKEIAVADTDIGKLGMLICKDGFNKYSHFLYEKLGKLGAEIICIPTWSIGWKELDIKEYVKGLFVYGAFISRSYVLMSGNLNLTTNSFGKSLIVSPVRGVLKEGSVNRKEILYNELDLDEVRRARDFDSRWQPKEATTLRT